MAEGNPKRVGVVLGTRPEAIKLASVVQELRRHEPQIETFVISTGQHREMLRQVLDLFDIVPDVDLELMGRGQSVEYVVAETVRKVPEQIRALDLDALLVQGDTATAFAAGLAAYYCRIPIGHVEAGLRTYDKFRPFPEEINRRLLGHVADWHFAPTASGKQALLAENIDPAAIHVTGNTVVDALQYTVQHLGEGFEPFVDDFLSSAGKKILLTAHRRESFGRPLEQICRAVLELVGRFPDLSVLYPVHLNPNVQETVGRLLAGHDRIALCPPIDYRHCVKLLTAVDLVLTDSGGIQEEAPTLGKPVLVLRETTERPEAVDAGTARLVGTAADEIVSQASRLLSDRAAYDEMARAANPYGDGLAARRIVSVLAREWGLVDAAVPEFSRE